MVEAVVFAGAKILIFQQITTIDPNDLAEEGCFCWCKDTNFSANHNCSALRKAAYFVVFAGAKILIFQQITTALARLIEALGLFLLVQRY